MLQVQEEGNDTDGDLTIEESTRMNKVNMSMIYKLNIYHEFTEIYKCFVNNIVFAYMQGDNNSHADNCTIKGDNDEEWNTKTRSKIERDREEVSRGGVIRH